MEPIGRDLREMQRVPLTAEHVAALRAEGSEAIYPAGTYIVRPGDPVDRFIYVEDGEIEVVNPFGEERHVPSTIGPTQFMGEISFLGGGSWSIPMRAARDTRVLEVPRPAMLRLMAAIPEMSDIIITVLAARRRRQLDMGDSTLVLIGSGGALHRRVRQPQPPALHIPCAGQRRCPAGGGQLRGAGGPACGDLRSRQCRD